ncbi:DctP family TRAP transporter solute-binding subunit [Mesorhizobium sp. 1B3]|uniref:DctP family TRAP transporter solute-binding subunit n=1 Tax=Mesorhizobium sp. 1B3 TaxID=3243599 RepID=UPI003D9588BB
MSFAVGMTRFALRWTIAAGAIAFAVGAVFAQDGVQERKLRFAMSVGTNSPWTQAAQRFADAVEKATDGKIDVTVFPDGQLSNGNQVAEFELLQNGTVDFTFHSSIILSTLDPRFSLFSMPWIAPSDDQLFALMDGPGREVWNGLEEKGVKPLGGFSTSGFRQLTNNKVSVTKPEDLAGLTLRVPGLKLYQGIFKTFGVNPVPTSFGELYGALQQGVVDGQENPISLIYVSRFHEVQKHMTIWNYSADSIGILTNQALWEQLSPQEQEIFTTAAKEAAAWHRAEQTSADAKLLEEISKTLEVVTLTPEQIAAFQGVMEPIYAEWEPVIGADLLKAARGQ